MPWMEVQQANVDEGIRTVVNTDTIIFVSGAEGHGAYLKFSDGSVMQVVDSFKEIIQVVLKADEKKK